MIKKSTTYGILQQNLVMPKLRKALERKIGCIKILKFESIK